MYVIDLMLFNLYQQQYLLNILSLSAAVVRFFKNKIVRISNIFSNFAPSIGISWKEIRIFAKQNNLRTQIGFEVILHYKRFISIELALSTAEVSNDAR